VHAHLEPRRRNRCLTALERSVRLQPDLRYERNGGKGQKVTAIQF